MSPAEKVRNRPAMRPAVSAPPMAYLRPVSGRSARDYRGKRMGRFYGVFLAATLLAGCSPRLARVSRVIRPRQLGAVAVLPFASPRGSVFADRVAYELLNNGATLVAQSRVAGLLARRGLGARQFSPISPVSQLLALGRDLHADTVVVGQVTAPPRHYALLDRMQDFSGYPVTSAAIRFVRVGDGTTVSYVSYRREFSIPLLQNDSYEVAHQLVDAVFGR